MHVLWKLQDKEPLGNAEIKILWQCLLDLSKGFPGQPGILNLYRDEESPPLPKEPQINLN